MVKQIQCEKCGKTIGDNQKFCPFCGSAVENNNDNRTNKFYDLPTTKARNKFPVKIFVIILSIIVLAVAGFFGVRHFVGDSASTVGENKADLFMLRKNVSDERAVFYVERDETCNAEEFNKNKDTIINRIKSFDPSAEITDNDNRISVTSNKELYSEYGYEMNIFGVDGTLGLVIDDYLQEEKKVYELDTTSIVSVECSEESGYVLGEQLSTYDVISQNITMSCDVDIYIADEPTVSYVKVSVNESAAEIIKNTIELASQDENGVLAVSDCKDLSEYSNCWNGGTELGSLYPVPGTDFKEFYIIPENITSVANANLIKTVIEGQTFDIITRTDSSPLYYGFMNSNGDVVIDLEYDYLREPTEGLIAAQKQAKWGVIDEKGNEVIPFEYDTIGGFHNGLAIVRLDSKYGVMNNKGKIVVDYQFDDICSFGDGVAAVKKDEKWGVIDEKGQLVLDYQYDDANISYEEIMAVKKDGKWGGIDKTGNVIIPFEYEEAFEFSQGELCPVKKDGRYGFINKQGEAVIPFNYSNADYFSEGLAAVEQHDLYGYIDEEGNEVIPFRYKWAYPMIDGWAGVTEDYDKEPYFIDINNEVVFKPGYEDINPFVDGLCYVMDNGYEFYINKDGEKVGPTNKVF